MFFAFMKKITIPIFFLISITQTIALAEPAPASVYIKDGECGLVSGGDEFTIYIPKDKRWIEISYTHVVDLDECSKILSKMNNEPQEKTKATCKKLAETDLRWKGDIKVQWICEHEGFIWVDKIDAISLPGPAQREKRKCLCSSIVSMPEENIALKLSLVCLCVLILYKR